MSSLSDRGGGFFSDLRKRFLNTVSGRKRVTKRLYRPIKLSESQEIRRKTLKKKWFKTKNEKNELKRLEAEVSLTNKNLNNFSGIPRTFEKERVTLLRENRSKKEKKYNRFYNTDNNVILPITVYPMFPGDIRRKAKVIPMIEKEMKKKYKIRFEEDIPEKKIVYTYPETNTNNPANTGASREKNKILEEENISNLSKYPKKYRKTMILKQDNQFIGKLRIYKYLYDILQNVDVTSEDYIKKVQYATEDELRELFSKIYNFRIKYQRQLFPKFDKRSNEEIENESTDVPEILFHKDIDYLETAVKNAEKNGYAVPAPGETEISLIANSWGRQWGRVWAGLGTRRDLDYDRDVDLHAGVDNDFVFKPITEFKNSIYTICVHGGFDHFQYTLQGNPRGCSHYIVTHPLYTNLSVHMLKFRPFGIHINASKFLETSFVIDAFHEQAIDTMDDDLFRLIMKTDRSLIDAAKVTLATVPYFQSLKVDEVYNEHYMIFKEGALEKDILYCYRNPLLLLEVAAAMQKPRKFLFSDPYTTYCSKKKDPMLWSQAFGVSLLKESFAELEPFPPPPPSRDKKLMKLVEMLNIEPPPEPPSEETEEQAKARSSAVSSWKEKAQSRYTELFRRQDVYPTSKQYNYSFSIYEQLETLEKFFVDFYQFALILQKSAKTNNNERLNQNRYEEAATSVYRMPLNDPEFLEFIEDNSKPDDIEFKRFKRLQEKHFQYYSYIEKKKIFYEFPILTPRDVQRVLAKLQGIEYEVTVPTEIPEGNQKYVNNWRQSKEKLAAWAAEEENARAARRAAASSRRSTAAAFASRRSRPVEPPALVLRSVEPRPLNIQIESSLQAKKSELRNLLKNSVIVNKRTGTLKNRNEILRGYNQILALSLTNKTRSNYQKLKNLANAQFKRVNTLQQEISDLEDRLASL